MHEQAGQLHTLPGRPFGKAFSDDLPTRHPRTGVLLQTAHGISTTRAAIDT